MRYTEYLGIRKGFQASINLEFDLNNIDKIESYIPTEQSVKVLGTLLRSYYYQNESENRASVIVGPYGRGKSHLLLVLTALTSLDLDVSGLKKDYLRNILENLCAKIESVSPEIGSLSRAVVESNIRTLPVIINSNTTDINQAFLIAISNSLTMAKLEHLLPTTYFDSALIVIDKWKESFPRAYKMFQSELKKKKLDADDLCVGLRQFNQDYYALFCSIYPTIAAGTEFNPLMNMDVVKLYTSVAVALKEQTDYCGINIIFDEFSKFLESNLDAGKMLNLKIIQDMAEASSRSGVNQIHLTCVTHKDILDYSSSDSFKTVAGRFSEIRFIASSEQSYELIANAIEKKPSFSGFMEKHNEDLKLAKECYSLFGCFSDLEYPVFEQKIVFGCFPLAPLSSYALLRVSELVGQNERTLFSFISQNDENTLQSFICQEHDSFDFITIDYIFNYFEDLFRKEIFNKKVYSSWNKASAAFKKTTDTMEKNIIKAIAVINMISDDYLKPTPNHLKACLMLSDAALKKAITGLLTKRIVSERDDNTYALLSTDEVNLQTAIDSISKSTKRFSFSEILTQNHKLGYIIPREYNDKFSMLRFFKKVYYDAASFAHIKNSNQLLLEYDCDGLIIYIIDTDNSYHDMIIEKIRAFQTTPNIVVCLSKIPFAEQELLTKSIAISELQKKHSHDEDYLKELEVFEESIRNRIRDTVEKMFSPSSTNSEFYNCKGKLNVSNNVSLMKEISSICFDTFSLTPVINNEMVNKRVLNSQNLKGRDLVVTWLLEHANENEIPFISGYGPEVSIFNSVFKHTGLYKSAKVADKGINEIVRIIKEFITGCEKKQRNFDELYRKIAFPPYSVRKGLIPLFIAYVIRQYLNNVVLYFKNKEVELSAAIISSLNEDPEKYYLLIETGTQEKEEYLDELEIVFSQNSDTSVSSVNKCYSVVKAMQNWIRSMPEYTKKFDYYFDGGEKKQVDSTVQLIRRELLKFEVNARDLLFQQFLEGLHCENYLQSLECIKNTKRFLDMHLYNRRQELKAILATIFVPGYGGTISNAVISWYHDLPEYTKTKVFDSRANSLLSISKETSSYDDESLLDKIVLSFTSIGIADWNDEVCDRFIIDIKDAVSRINSYRETDSFGQKCKLTIQLSGGIYEKSFAADSISPLGETALNNLRSVFEEYNGALEPDEQLAIISQLIEDIIQ